jgi:hypothetical protein
MSCCGPTIKRYIFQCPGSEEGTTYTFSNVNVTGQGVFSGLVGSDAQFKGIASSGATVTVTNDAANKTVNLEVNTAAVVAAIPDSTTAVKGKTAFNSDAEAIAKTLTTKALTASNLAALGASTTFAGLTRLATVPEAQTGTATNIAVTPAGLDAVASAIPTQRVFANSGVRDAATPDYVGQFGVQQDSGTAYISNGLAAGDWFPAFIVLGTDNSMESETGFDLNATGNFNVTNNSATAGVFSFSSDAVLQIDPSGYLNFTSGGRLQTGGVNIPANSVITTSSTAGQVDSMLIASFISSDSASEVYTVTNGTVSRTFDADTVTLPQLADIVSTLLVDLEQFKRIEFPV